jgi:CheY-like chemotaxis protein/nitrogen-specific signal transduction histidine kinase
MAKVRRSAKRRARKPRAASPRAVEATLAALAHDIRTPLTGILALGELLATSGLGARERAWAAAIKDTAEHLAMLTSLIVDASRAQARGLVLQRLPFRPRQLAATLGASLAARAGAKQLESDVAFADDLPETATGDPLRLRGAIENLIDNAVKFTDRGRVRLAVDAKPIGRRRVRLVFTVSDSGIGLSAAEIGRLFRPFAQASEKIALRYGGAGLGLSFVKRIAKAMHGDLIVKSKPGGGSTFRFTATVDRVTPAEAARETAPGLLRATRPLTVLCVEDNPYGRVVLNTILTELGHHADFVGTGEAAVEAAAGYDVVLMDVTLPGIDGLEATRRIRAQAGTRIAVIGVSGRGSADEEARARAAGMDDYLTKPLSPSALARALPA